MDALKRYPRHKRRAVAREWGRRSQAVQAEARKQREPGKTLRARDETQEREERASGLRHRLDELRWTQGVHSARVHFFSGACDNPDAHARSVEHLDMPRREAQQLTPRP